MSSPTKFANGQPCWLDISTPDRAKSEALESFLTALFGWTFQRSPAEGGGYSSALSHGKDVAGLMEMAGVPSYWTTYLHTDDIKQSIDSFAKHGGKVLNGPMPISDMGHMAIVQDAVGAVLGLWQPIKFEGFGSYNEDNSPSWFDHQSENSKLAADFYRDVFGLTVVSTPGSEGAMLGSKDVQWFSTSPQPGPMPPSWNPVIQVDSLSRVENEIKRLGGEILMNGVAVPGGNILVFTDPVVHAPLICFEAVPEPNAT